MTNAEIKKAFETFKKEIKKEAGLAYGFTMNRKQIEKRTATYLVCNTIDIDWEIANTEKSMEKAGSAKDWYEKRLAVVKAEKERFGTKENELKETVKIIENSKAFSKFTETIGKTELTTEENDNCYYIRFNY